MHSPLQYHTDRFPYPQKIPVLHLLTPHPHEPLTTTALSAFSTAVPFPECHIDGIKLGSLFGLASLPQQHASQRQAYRLATGLVSTSWASLAHSCFSLAHNTVRGQRLSFLFLILSPVPSTVPSRFKKGSVAIC